MDILPFDDRDGFIWMNGEIINWRDAKTHVICHGLHYGSLVFEGERTYNGKIFKAEEHSIRLIESGKIMDMKIPWSKDELNNFKYELLKKNNLKDAYVRAFSWRGSEMMAVSAQKTKIHTAIAVWEWPSYFNPEAKMRGLNLDISDWKRPSQECAPVHAKAAGLYMICTLSKHEAERQGYSESLMLDHEGYVAESTSANVFFKDNKGELHTPIPDCFLDGITRRTVIDIAKSKNIKVVERKIKPEELLNFTGCFLTGTAAEVTPVSQIDKYKFTVCNVIKDLSESYQALVRKK